ncbi:MAG: hypothetical protein MZV49_18640 [Rhodopseudomonas palustris]|nr:hypothetical protein [Rhodopseudomonas palustris]
MLLGLSLALLKKQER